MTIIIEFGDILRGTRERASMTMGEVARALGVNVTYLSDVERGRRVPPSAERILHIARILGANPVPLLEAAARVRGAFELEAEGITDQARNVGAQLQAQWSSLSADDLNGIEAVLTRKKS
jgi:transcriptional regulator with XRE-family HTH domain